MSAQIHRHCVPAEALPWFFQSSVIHSHMYTVPLAIAEAFTWQCDKLNQEGDLP